MRHNKAEDRTSRWALSAFGTLHMREPLTPFAFSTPTPDVFNVPFNERWRARFRTYLGNVSRTPVLVADRVGLRLAMAMMRSDLSGQPTEPRITQHMQRIATALGGDGMDGGAEDYVQLEDSARRFLAAWNRVAASPVGIPAPWPDRLACHDHHLRMGKIVGDALGVHYCLGAMLCPPIDRLPAGEVANVVFSRWVRHRVAHHACGYLYHVHRQGPGYRYMADGAQTSTSRAKARWGHHYLLTWAPWPWRALRLEPVE